MARQPRKLASITEQLYSAPLIKEVLQEFQPVLESRGRDPRVVAAERRKGKLPPLVVTPKEDYVIRVFKRVASVQHVFERIDHVLVYLEAFPQRAGYSRKGITRHDWNLYHLGQYLSAVVSSVDVCLLLTNDVLRIGLDERDCKLEVFCAQANVKGTKLASALKGLDKGLRKEKALRNLDYHRAERPDIAELIGDLDYDLAQLAAFTELFYKDNLADSQAIRVMLEWGASSLRKWIEEGALRTADDVVGVLDQLRSAFHRQYAELDLRSMIAGKLEHPSKEPRPQESARV